MSRGDRLEAIYRDEEDREKFLSALGEACEKAGWEVYAYCLMKNHFHLVLETPQPTLVAGMKWLLGTYTQRYNARHRERGHVFAGRYKSLLVDNRDNYYLRVVCNYVHLNPLRAHLLEEGAGLESYPWSSYPEYLKSPGKRKSWIRVDRLMGEMGCKESARGREDFAKIMEARIEEAIEEEETLMGKIRRGWKFGADDFLERLEEKLGMVAKRGSHREVEVQETMEAKAERIIDEEMRQRRMTPERWKKLKKMDPVKVEIACRLRRETILTMGWIAKRLTAGTAGTLAVGLHHSKQSG